MSTRWFSLRRRLLGLLLGGLSAAWLATMVFSYFDAHAEVDALFDAQLVQSAQTLMALAGQPSDHPFHDHGEALHKYQRRLRFQIWSGDGHLLTRSADAPETPLMPGDGFSETTDAAAGHWRHFSLLDEERGLRVQVSEDHRYRDELIGHIAWRILMPALLGLPLLGFWIWLATRRGLVSLDDIAEQIAHRDPAQLQEVAPSAAPVEIRPLLDALNRLLRRVDSALQGERRFTADAAHELRTPLAALQAQAQVALRARDEAERSRSLEQLQQGLARAAHLVDQMLQLARLDPESEPPGRAPVELATLCEDVCAELGGQILAHELDFSLEQDGPCVVNGQADWLRVLIRNLVDNAVRYTPAGGRVRVWTGQEGNARVLRVSDSGPGIAPAMRAQAVRRFHRLDPAAQPGSGLGLAIVARIAELHGARLILDETPGGGLDVRVWWTGARD